MFRAAVFSFMLTLTVGQNAALFCRAWCDPQVAASGCHHGSPASPTSVAVDDDGCDHEVPDVGAFLREEVRPGAFPPPADHAPLVRRFQIGGSPTDTRPGQEPGREWSLERRPLATALRI